MEYLLALGGPFFYLTEKLENYGHKFLPWVPRKIDLVVEGSIEETSRSARSSRFSGAKPTVQVFSTLMTSNGMDNF
jgi:hypothetical protein